MLIWDDGPVARKVVVKSSDRVEDTVNTGKNNRTYWIVVAKPEHKCRVLGRCKFWLCSSSDGPNGDVPTTSEWSQWVWDTRRRQFGRYRLFRGVYEYAGRIPNRQHQVLKIESRIAEPI